MLGPLESDYYVALNRNKKDIAIDLGSDEGRDLALELVAKSDIVVQNFRPGVMDRLGLGFEASQQARPGIIYCSLSAFGPTGPLAARPANDIIVQALSGMMGITGELGGGPVRVGAPIIDYSTGMFGLIGVLTALFARDEHPEGQHIEVAMLDSAITFMANYVPTVLGVGETIPRLGRTHAQIVPYQAFECSDDAYVMVGAFTQGFWLRLCQALGRADLVKDPRFDRNADRLQHRNILVPMLEAEFRKRTRDEWLKVLETADVPASPVLELHEALRSEQAQANNVVHEVGADGVSVPTARLPIRSSSWPLAASGTPPRIGQDTREVLAEVLEKNADEIARYAESNVIGVEMEVTR
jgi:crotonobetainyl-CoA:carnitine CoA-transferase CaiB-like acyl-CoA transferase